MSDIETPFLTFLEDYEPEQGMDYIHRLEMLPSKNKSSLIIDFVDLYNHDSEFANRILKNPNTHFPAFNSVLRSKLRTRNPIYEEQLEHIYTRVRGLLYETPLRQVGSKQIGSLIQVSGIIVTCASVKPKLVNAVFRCPACGELTYIEQNGASLESPQKCVSCDNRKGFNADSIVKEESTWIDSQQLKIQETQDDIPAGNLPRSISVELLDDLCGSARPGDRVSVVGTIKLLPKYGRSGALLVFDPFLNANSVSVQSDELALMELTKEDIDQILLSAKDPEIFDNLVQSFAPSIYGNKEAKSGIILSMVGGVTKIIASNKKRGESHTLLVGDPGQAKTQLIEFAFKSAPRAFFTTGQGSSNAGLTCAVVKDKSGEGGYILEAGALVLADKGLCVIDEFEKMKEEERGGMHTAMSNGLVPVAKGGIVATLNARTTIIATANPIQGNWNIYQSVAQNIGNLTTPLLSRFDLMFLFKDKKDEVLDSMIANHIVSVHVGNSETNNPPLDILHLKKYISYAKTFSPKFTLGLQEKLTNFYVGIRKGASEQTVTITARHIEAIIRLSEAHAKIHLRETVIESDLDKAIELMTHSLHELGVDPETGEMDVSRMYGTSGSLQQELGIVIKTISDMERLAGNAKDIDLFETLKEGHKFTQNQINRFLKTLMSDGTIFMPRPGYYRSVS